MALCLLSLWKSPQHFQYWQEWNFQKRGAQEFHIFTRRASRNEWFNLMNFLSWKLALSQHDFPSPSSSRLLLKFSSQFFINTCFLVGHAQSIRSLSWCIFVIILKCPWEIIAVWRIFHLLMSLDAFESSSFFPHDEHEWCCNALQTRAGIPHFNAVLLMHMHLWIT